MDLILQAVIGDGTLLQPLIFDDLILQVSLIIDDLIFKLLLPSRGHLCSSIFLLAAGLYWEFLFVEFHFLWDFPSFLGCRLRRVRGLRCFRRPRSYSNSFVPIPTGYLLNSGGSAWRLLSWPP